MTGTEVFDPTMHIEVLRENLPMKRYVSRGDTRDVVDIAGPHEEADRAALRAIRFTRQDKTPRFQPVLGSAGMGKTHLFWVLRDLAADPKNGQYSTVYVPSPPSPVRVPLHFYSCLVDEAGDRFFELASSALLGKYGASADMDTDRVNAVMERALMDYPGISSDAVNVLLHYALDNGKRALARRWLLGDALTSAELEQLSVRTILEEDDVTLAAFKLLADNSDSPIVLFVDEMEGPFNTHGEEGERQFLEVIKRLYNECKNLVIVASCLSEIWPRIFEMADAPMRSRMEAPVNLRAFSEQDVANFVAQSMAKYWEEQNMEPPPDPLFPLTARHIHEAFVKSRGVPREAIRQIINLLDTILLGRVETAVAPQDDHVIKLTSSVVIGGVVKAVLIAGIRAGVDVRLKTASGGGAKQASAVVSMTRRGITRQVSVDVPSVKNWDRSGGVAAFYSAQRIKNTLDDGTAELGIVAVPEGTKGAKFESMTAELGSRLIVIRFNETSATRLVASTNKAQLDDSEREMFREVVERVFS